MWRWSNPCIDCFLQHVSSYENAIRLNKQLRLFKLHDCHVSRIVPSHQTMMGIHWLWALIHDDRESALRLPLTVLRQTLLPSLPLPSLPEKHCRQEDDEKEEEDTSVPFRRRARIPATAEQDDPFFLIPLLNLPGKRPNTPSSPSVVWPVLQAIGNIISHGKSNEHKR